MILRARPTPSLTRLGRHVRANPAVRVATLVASTAADVQQATSASPGPPVCASNPKVRAVEQRAMFKDGLYALEELERVDESDISLLMMLGSVCLQAYHQRIQYMSIREARDDLVFQDAGARVLRWTGQPRVMARLKEFHPADRSFVRMLVDIAVGAGRLRTIEAWFRYQPPDVRRARERLEYFKPDAVFKKLQAWQDLLVAYTLNALRWWTEDQSADVVYEYFTRIIEEKIQYNYAPENPLAHLYLRRASNECFRFMLSRVPAKAHTFETCLERLSPLIDLRDEDALKARPRHHLYIAACWLAHPVKPITEPLLDLLRRICLDANEPLRTWAPGFSPGIDNRPLRPAYHLVLKASHAVWLQNLALQAREALQHEGRTEEAEWVVDVTAQLWGHDEGQGIQYFTEDEREILQTDPKVLGEAVWELYGDGPGHLRFFRPWRF
ncbi:hypothetical protein F4780DRAFT_778589 [Xylariomycetidae sp. FL0641]|nr:hypothetical protein F4780DRAFT_778589 [Xylariomycetidae sp. FL0641]